jgi:hypothetical protein
MKKALITVTAVAVLGFFAGSASAQCSFNSAGKAKGFKTSMVRAYSSCPGITYASPNSSTMAGVPTCAPPVALSVFKFNSKGKCDVKSGHKLENPCSDPGSSVCSNLTLSVKCSGITQADGVTLDSSPGWNLNTIARATFDDNSNGDMTVIDFPAQFPLGQAASGKLKGKFTTNELLVGLFGPGSALPGCTQIELLTIKIADPAGNLFASIGSGSR